MESPKYLTKIDKSKLESPRNSVSLSHKFWSVKNSSRKGITPLNIFNPSVFTTATSPDRFTLNTSNDSENLALAAELNRPLHTVADVPSKSSTKLPSMLTPIQNKAIHNGFSSLSSSPMKMYSHHNSQPNTCFDFSNHSKILEHQEKLKRSNDLKYKRKGDNELSPTKNHLKSSSNENLKDLQSIGGKTITRFIDTLILKGNLPLEATEFNSPKLEKMPASSKHKHNCSINKSKVQKVVNEEIDEIEDTNVTEASVIPAWMRELPEFAERFKIKQLVYKLPIIEILKKLPFNRDKGEEDTLVKWLEKFDLFAKFPYDVLLEISRRLKALHFNEGDTICNVGDIADCLYIIYSGAVDVTVPEKGQDRLIVRVQAGELLGRQTLETAGKRTAKLIAVKSTYVISLGRMDYQEVSGDIKNLIKPSQIIAEFVMKHEFLKQFPETKKLSLLNNVEYKKLYKNDIVYNLGDASDCIYFFIKGKVTRQMAITTEKANKWPTGLKSWKLYKETTRYLVKISLEPGEIFGVSEFINQKPRIEKVIAEDDSMILMCPREMFYKVFESYEVFQFEKKAKEDDGIKASKITEIFEKKQRLQKIKDEHINNNLPLIRKPNKSNSQLENIERWKEAEEKLAHPEYKQKKLVEKNVVKKDLKSVYEG